VSERDPGEDDYELEMTGGDYYEVEPQGFKPDYGNGGAISRGEFIQHMQRIDEALKEIKEVLAVVQAKLRSGRRALTEFGLKVFATVGALSLPIAGFLITHYHLI
jgi:hypothetical protein